MATTDNIGHTPVPRKHAAFRALGTSFHRCPDERLDAAPCTTRSPRRGGGETSLHSLYRKDSFQPTLTTHARAALLQLRSFPPSLSFFAKHTYSPFFSPSTLLYSLRSHSLYLLECLPSFLPCIYPFIRHHLAISLFHLRPIFPLLRTHVFHRSAIGSSPLASPSTR